MNNCNALRMHAFISLALLSLSLHDDIKRGVLGGVKRTCFLVPDAVAYVTDLCGARERAACPEHASFRLSAAMTRQSLCLLRAGRARGFCSPVRAYTKLRADPAGVGEPRARTRNLARPAVLHVHSHAPPWCLLPRDKQIAVAHTARRQRRIAAPGPRTTPRLCCTHARMLPAQRHPPCALKHSPAWPRLHPPQHGT